MSTNIFNFDGSLLTTVPDGSIDTTHASIKFPGRGYVNYGAPVNENMLWIMQNFASATAPANAVTGQTWYDTTAQLLKVYTGSTWVETGGVILSSAPPSGTAAGSLWFDTENKQMYTWSGTEWLLLGPLGSATNTDPLNPSAPTYSQIDAARISDGTNNHQVWRISIGGIVFAIISKDSVFSPSPSINGFATIRPGINFNTNIADVGISGDTTIFRNNQTNLPNVDNTYNLGSASFRFANMHAVNFNGVASSARYADLAERYQADRAYTPGTVLTLGGEKEVTASSSPGDASVFGVVSTDPAYLMNADAGSNETHPSVAFAGRVPCKVIGQVKKGQRLMTSSMEGVACAWDQSFGYLSILGRSLVDKTSHGIETIEIVVGKN
jgi:hypothetical protein